MPMRRASSIAGDGTLSSGGGFGGGRSNSTVFGSSGFENFATTGNSAPPANTASAIPATTTSPTTTAVASKEVFTTSFEKPSRMPTVSVERREKEVVTSHYEHIKLHYNIFPPRMLHALFAEIGIGTQKWILVAARVLQDKGWHEITREIGKRMFTALEQLANTRDSAASPQKGPSLLMENISTVGVPVLSFVRDTLQTQQVDESQSDDLRPQPIPQEEVQEALELLVSSCGVAEDSLVAGDGLLKQVVSLDACLLALSRIKHVAVGCEALVAATPVVLLEAIARLVRNLDSQAPPQNACSTALAQQAFTIYSKAVSGLEDETHPTNYIEMTENLGLLATVTDVSSDPFGPASVPGHLAPESPLRKSSIANIADAFGLNLFGHHKKAGEVGGSSKEVGDTMLAGVNFGTSLDGSNLLSTNSNNNKEETSANSNNSKTNKREKPLSREQIKELTSQAQQAAIQDLMTLETISRDFFPANKLQRNNLSNNKKGKSGGDDDNSNPTAFLNLTADELLGNNNNDNKDFATAASSGRSMRKASRSVITMMKVSSHWKTSTDDSPTRALGRAMQGVEDDDSDREVEDEEEEEEHASASELAAKCAKIISPVVNHPGTLVVQRKSKYGHRNHNHQNFHEEGEDDEDEGHNYSSSKSTRSSTIDPTNHYSVGSSSSSSSKKLKTPMRTSVMETINSQNKMTSGAKLFHLRQQLAQLQKQK